MYLVSYLGRAKLGESRSPISGKLDVGDSLNVGHQDVPLAVEEADPINWMRELDLPQEPFVRVPDPDHAALIASDNQADKLVRVAASHGAVVLLLLLVFQMVDLFVLSIELEQLRLPSLEYEQEPVHYLLCLGRLLHTGYGMYFSDGLLDPDALQLLYASLWEYLPHFEVVLLAETHERLRLGEVPDQSDRLSMDREPAEDLSQLPHMEDLTSPFLQSEHYKFLVLALTVD